MFSSEFIVTSLIVVLIPGTGVIYTVSAGLFMDRRSSLAAAFGCTAGILPHITASILGLSAILHTSAVVFQSIKYIGACYLMYLAWSMWRSNGALRFNAPVSRQSLFQVAVKGFLINILNPKLSIFFLAFLPLFISAGTASPLADMVLLSGVFMGMTLVVFSLYGLAANAFSRYVVNSPTMVERLQRSFAAVFAVLGVKLALTER